MHYTCTRPAGSNLRPHLDPKNYTQTQTGPGHLGPGQVRSGQVRSGWVGSGRVGYKCSTVHCTCTRHNGSNLRPNLDPKIILRPGPVRVISDRSRSSWARRVGSGWVRLGRVGYKCSPLHCTWSRPAGSNLRPDPDPKKIDCDKDTGPDPKNFADNRTGPGWVGSKCSTLHCTWSRPAVSNLRPNLDPKIILRPGPVRVISDRSGSSWAGRVGSGWVRLGRVGYKCSPLHCTWSRPAGSNLRPDPDPKKIDCDKDTGPDPKNFADNRTGPGWVGSKCSTLHCTWIRRARSNLRPDPESKKLTATWTCALTWKILLRPGPVRVGSKCSTLV